MLSKGKESRTDREGGRSGLRFVRSVLAGPQYNILGHSAAGNIRTLHLSSEADIG